MRKSPTTVAALAAICLTLAATTTQAVNLESFSDPLHRKAAGDVVADALAKEFSRQDNETFPLAAKAKPDNWFFVDIKPKCNMNIFSPKDQGTRCPVFIEQMPFGRQTYYGVPFEIIDPNWNKGETAIALASKRLQTTAYPNEVTLSIRHQAQALYLLMTAYYANREGKQSIAITYADGATQRITLRGSAAADFTQKQRDEELPGTLNIGDWYQARNIVHNTNSRYVLIPMRKGARASFHALHVLRWINPRPEQEIASIAFRSDRDAPMAPFIAAVTGVDGVQDVDLPAATAQREIRRRQPGKMVDRPVSWTTTGPVWCIGSYDEKMRPDIITAASVGITGSKPPYVTVSLREASDTYHNITKNQAYTVCVPDTQYVKQADFYGLVSGRDHDKFKESGLTPVASKLVKAPYPREFPVVLECRLFKTVKLGSHTMFIGKIVGMKVHDNVLTDGKVDPAKLDSLFLSPADHGYYQLGPKVDDASSAGKSLIKE